VLVAPADSKTSVTRKPGFDLAALLGNGQLATGDLAHVQVGKYAKDALTELGACLKNTSGIQLIFTTEGVVIATAVMAFPLTVRAIRLSLDSVDRGIELAARTLGASRLDVLCTITLPMMLPGILSDAMTVFAASLEEFGAIITFASNIEGETHTSPLAIYTATQTSDGDAIALRLVGLSMALAVAAIILSECLDRRTRRWLVRP
jgi:molybdate transport system permease protein